VKWFRKYGRKVGWIVEIYGEYRRKVGWIVKLYGKYERKLVEKWIDTKNMKEK
jgi:hypothetical protein